MASATQDYYYGKGGDSNANGLTWATRWGSANSPDGTDNALGEFLAGTIGPGLGPGTRLLIGEGNYVLTVVRLGYNGWLTLSGGIIQGASLGANITIAQGIELTASNVAYTLRNLTLSNNNGFTVFGSNALLDVENVCLTSGIDVLIGEDGATGNTFLFRKSRITGLWDVAAQLEASRVEFDECQIDIGPAPEAVTGYSHFGTEIGDGGTLVLRKTRWFSAQSVSGLSSPISLIVVDSGGKLILDHSELYYQNASPGYDVLVSPGGVCVDIGSAYNYANVSGTITPVPPAASPGVFSVVPPQSIVRPYEPDN